MRIVQIFILSIGLFLGVNNLGYANLKARIGFFIPIEGLFRDIYGGIGPTYELEADQMIFKNISIWENVNFSNMHGSSIGLCDPTDIYLASLSLGAKFSYWLNNFNTYAGLGVVGSGVWINNENTICNPHASKFVIGGVLKLGVKRSILAVSFIDFFADYYVLPVKFENRIDLGGLRIGVGFGFRF